MFKQRYTPLFSTTIPHQAQFQLQHEPLIHKLKENWQLLRREASLCFTGQNRLLQKRILVNCQRILWLAPAIRNIGDAIMAFSGRSLLAGSYQVDALVDTKVASLFNDDDCFSRVYTDPSQVPTDYDLIILDTVKSISIKTKRRYFPQIPFCHFRGHFDGIELNWILFSFHRINALLGYPYSQQQLDQLARPHLHLSPATKTQSAIVLAIGGEDHQRRVYPHWAVIIDYLLTSYPGLTISLLGNNNALADGAKLLTQFAGKLDNQIGKLSLVETAQVINSSRLFIGCDGGLMHIASACAIPGIALFGFFASEYRLPYTSKLVPLFHQQTVSAIDPAAIIALLPPLISAALAD